MSAPFLTIAIPTFNRSSFLDTCLQSLHDQVYRESFEVLVCDNASADGTARVVESHAPWLNIRHVLNETNIGFDGNYIRCLEEAHGERVWVLGDDDAAMPHSVEMICNSTADFTLLAPIECDFHMKPLHVRNWFGRMLGFKVDTSTHLVEYMNLSQFEACVGAFISAMVVPRERVLRHLDKMKSATGGGFVHLWGTLPVIMEGATLDWDIHPVFLNRLDNDGLAQTDPFRRSTIDLRAWVAIGRELMFDKPEMREAFYGIHRRNFRNQLPRTIRGFAPSTEAWEEVRPLLLEVGYTEKECE